MNSEIAHIRPTDTVLGMSVTELAVLAGVANGNVQETEAVQAYLSGVFGEPVPDHHSNGVVRRMLHLHWIETSETSTIALSPVGSSALDSMYGFVVRLIDNGSNLLDRAVLLKMLNNNGETL